MNSSFYTQNQLRVFSENLLATFVDAGFEVVEEPYIDYALCGFRATYVRRYTLNQPTSLYDGILTTIIHVVGLPFGHHGHKMVILSAPRNLENEPVSETLKLRIRFNDDGMPSIVAGGEQQQKQSTTDFEPTTSGYNAENPFVSQIRNQSNQQISSHNGQECNKMKQFNQDLADYVAHIIETISPGLIQLPTDMKLEILKKLSIDSIIKMSQVNSEFRSLIFNRGESLWRHLCYRDFNIKSINRFVHKSWMELYRDTYVIHQVEICRKERALPGLPERPALPPAPYRLQIGWLPMAQVLELPFYPDNQMPHLALEFHPLHRANSLDSLS